MKILWITNMLIGELSKAIHGRTSNGLWIEAALFEFQKQNEHEIVIATVGKITKTRKLKEENVTYYLVPDSNRTHYNPNKVKNQRAWMEIINNEKPDLIHIWGTEFKHGLCAQLAMQRFSPNKKIPTLIYMQGVIAEIAYYYYAGMTFNEIIKNTTIRDFAKCDTIFAQKRSYEKRSIFEAKMMNMADGVIVENEWCKTHVHNIAPNVAFHNLPLNINRCFAEKEWNVKNSGTINLICNATGYPLKGLHMLLKALSVVKEKYPDIILNIPGKNLEKKSKFSFLFGSSYSLYINRLIRKFGLEKNVHWLGTLSQRQLADFMVTCNVFILCSALENHSSSLKEAMLLGMPCIASNVGGISEYVINGVNAILYRYDDYLELASNINCLLKDSAKSQRLSLKAKRQMSTLHDEGVEYKKLCAIYQSYIGTPSSDNVA